jgi:hypothetical protein
MKTFSTRLTLVAGMVACVACTNPFAPEREKWEGGDNGPAPPATTPGQLIDNLRRAMRDRDNLLYEALLDQDFWFTETDCRGDLMFANGREQELEIMGGSRDGSQKGIFDIYRSSFEFEFTLLTPGIELGSEYPEAYTGDPDGHPDEDWETFRGQVYMEIVDENGDGFRVAQVMTYKLRLAEDGLWKMIRWVDDPLAGDCETGKIPANLLRWSDLKRGVR